MCRHSEPKVMQNVYELHFTHQYINIYYIYIASHNNRNNMEIMLYISFKNLNIAA